MTWRENINKFDKERSRELREVLIVGGSDFIPPDIETPEYIDFEDSEFFSTPKKNVGTFSEILKKCNKMINRLNIYKNK